MLLTFFFIVRLPSGYFLIRWSLLAAVLSPRFCRSHTAVAPAASIPEKYGRARTARRGLELHSV
jgi:hypothetical protein